MNDGSGRPLLRSERLLLRPAERGDIETIAGWINDADVQETLGVRGPLSQAAEERWFERLQDEQGKSRWHFVVCLRADGRPLGLAGLDRIDSINGAAEIGVSISQSSEWDKGYGTEVMEMLMDFGFGELRLHRIQLHVFTSNDRAVHVYEKVGFQHEGTEREAFYRHGRYLDVHVMGILRSEWEAQDRHRTWELG